MRSEIIQENINFSDQFELKLIGAISTEVLDSIRDFGLSKYVNNLGYISHQEALKHQRKSQVLLLIEIDSEETKSIIPGKLFEYMVSERPIIAIGPKEADFESIIKETKTGVFVTYQEKEKLKQYILSCFTQYLSGSLSTNAVGLQDYSRQNLTKKLVDLL